MTSEIDSPRESFRQCLSLVVAALCVEANYDFAEDIAMETLTEMLQSYITEIGKTTRVFCEHSGRTLPNTRDVMSALADMGFNSLVLPEYMHRSRRISFGQITKATETTSAPVLLVGKRRNFPLYISDQYNFPAFPDPHAYVRTKTGQKSPSDYAILRERLSEQRRDVEKALTRFVAKTGESHPLLIHDKNAFPLIAAGSTPLPYLLALLPSEHETMISLQHEENTSEESTSKSQGTNDKKELDSDVTMISREQSGKRRNEEVNAEQNDVIRNPFLRPVKKQKTKKKT